MGAARAGAAYFATVFGAGFALGTIRTVWVAYLAAGLFATLPALVARKESAKA